MLNILRRRTKFKECTIDNSKTADARFYIDPVISSANHVLNV